MYVCYKILLIYILDYTIHLSDPINSIEIMGAEISNLVHFDSAGCNRKGEKSWCRRIISFLSLTRMLSLLYTVFFSENLNKHLERLCVVKSGPGYHFCHWGYRSIRCSRLHVADTRRLALCGNHKELRLRICIMGKTNRRHSNGWKTRDHYIELFTYFLPLSIAEYGLVCAVSKMIYKKIDVLGEPWLLRCHYSKT